MFCFPMKLNRKQNSLAKRLFPSLPSPHSFHSLRSCPLPLLLGERVVQSKMYSPVPASFAKQNSVSNRRLRQTPEQKHPLGELPRPARNRSSLWENSHAPLHNTPNGASLKTKAARSLKRRAALRQNVQGCTVRLLLLFIFLCTK